jgi:hypothetical protein
MNIDINKISPPKQLIGGERRDKGVLQIFFQSTDSPHLYSTGLQGVYNMKLTDFKLIPSVSASYAIQMLSDTFRVDRGNINDNFKISYRTGTNEVPNPVYFYQMNMNNFVSIDFIQLGTIGADINGVGSTYNAILTFEYEKL